MSWDTGLGSLDGPGALGTTSRGRPAGSDPVARMNWSRWHPGGAMKKYKGRWT